MKLWLAKVQRNGKVGLIPTDDISQRIISRMGDGECAQIELVRPRSVQMHRLYFSICRTIGENQDPMRDADSIDAELRILAGHFDVMYVGQHEVRVPKRIAFAKLSHDEWMELWKSIEPAIAERFGTEYLAEAA